MKHKRKGDLACYYGKTTNSQRKRKNGVIKYLEVKKEGGSSNSFHVNNHSKSKGKSNKDQSGTK